MNLESGEVSWHSVGHIRVLKNCEEIQKDFLRIAVKKWRNY
jgi:hypothetical protein